MLGRSALALLACAGLFAACAVAITDEPLVSDETDGGRSDSAAGYGNIGNAAGSGGSSGSTGNGGWGGILGSGPLGGSDGSGGDGGTGSGSSGTGSTECTATQKRCNGQCVEPGPTVGCTLDNCTPCPAPFGSTAGCAEGACTLTCNAGYVKEGNTCVMPGSGGSGGAGGAGGSSGGRGGGSGSGSCVASSCPGCSVVGPFPCCAGNRCGCTWVPGGYCL